MGKNFTKSLGSKNLSSLIPTTTEGKEEAAVPEVKPVAKKQESKPIQTEEPVSVKKVLKREEPKVVKKVVVTSSKVPTIDKAKIPIEENPIVKAEVPIKEAPTTVTTFRIKDDNLLAIKAIAFWDRKKIQEVFNEALKDYVEKTPKNTLRKAISEYKRRH